MKVNQLVILKPVGDNARYIKDDIMNHLEEWEIIKVGRKYVTVRLPNSNTGEIKFDMEDHRQVVNCGGCYWELYLSVQEILDEAESERISYKLRNVFSGYGKSYLSLDKLRRIQDIIDEEVEKL